MKRSAPIKSGEYHALLVAWFVIVIAATLFPMNFRMPPKGHVELYQYSRQGFENVLDIFSNLLLFIPLGALLQQEGMRRTWRPTFVLGLAGASGLLLSLTVEYLQVFLPTRDSSLVDVLTNTTGALLGVFAYRMAAPLLPHLAKLRSRISLVALAQMMMVFSALALLVSGALQSQTRLSDWSLKYPLLVGNERTGNRPWRGRVILFELTDAATSVKLVREFAQGRPLTMLGHPIAMFDFAGSPPYKDTSGHLPNLDWTKRPRTPSPRGLQLPGSAWLRTEDSASGMIRRIRETNSFTLHILCATDDQEQRGPARILSNSWDPYRRNFTLGQQGKDMVFRLRTPSTGLNGMRPELVVPGVFSSGGMRDILVTYNGATLLAAVANSGEVHRMSLSPGSSLLAAYTRRTDDLPIYQLGYYALLFIPAGMLLGALAGSYKQWLGIAIPWMLVFPALLESTQVFASGRSFNWSNVELSTAVGALVVTMVSKAVSIAIRVPS